MLRKAWSFFILGYYFFSPIVEFFVSRSIGQTAVKGEKADPEIPGSRWIPLDPIESRDLLGS